MFNIRLHLRWLLNWIIKAHVMWEWNSFTLMRSGKFFKMPLKNLRETDWWVFHESQGGEKKCWNFQFQASFFIQFSWPNYMHIFILGDIFVTLMIKIKWKKWLSLDGLRRMKKTMSSPVPWLPRFLQYWLQHSHVCTGGPHKQHRLEWRQSKARMAIDSNFLRPQDGSIGIKHTVRRNIASLYCFNLIIGFLYFLDNLK